MPTRLVQPNSTRITRVGERLVILGTVHVDPTSVSQVGQTIARLKPSVVGLELDQMRFQSLVHQMKGIESGGRSSWSGLSVFMISLLERVAGGMTGSAPGKEMLRAAEEAQRVGARIAFIDLPIDQTMEAIRSLPKTERVKLVVDSVASILFLPFGGKGIGDLADNVTNQLYAFRRRYPKLSKLLIDKREEYMANRVRMTLDRSEGMVVIVIGLGHMASLAKKLQDYPTMIGDRGYRVGTSWTILT